jgi:hypothetical protein
MLVNFTKGLLVEYGLSLPLLALEFEFNPQTISRTRSINVATGTAPGTHGGYDFTLPSETPRVAQGVTVNNEEFSVQILIDATDTMADPNSPRHEIANEFGIEPELDTLRCMVEAKVQGPDGVNLLTSLGEGYAKAFQRDIHASVILFVWATHILPVFLTSVQVEETAHLLNLRPYRANVTLGMKVIESNNPFYNVEKGRQIVGAAMNLAPGVSTTLSAIYGGSF